MALYFLFNIYNSTQSVDNIGTECEGASEVRAEAVETLQQLFTGTLLTSADPSSMTINVCDTAGHTV